MHQHELHTVGAKQNNAYSFFFFFFFTAAKQVGLLEKCLSFICCTVDLVGSFNAMKLLLQNVLGKSQWASYNCVQVWQACVLKSSIHQKDFLTTHLLSNIFIWHGFVFVFFLFKSVHIFVQNVTIVCAGYFPQRWKTVSGMETTSKAQWNLSAPFCLVFSL